MDLLLIILASVILIPIAILTDGPVRLVLGLIFILFSPGYTLLSALFPKREDLATVQRLALSFGLSIALMPPIGFILHFTPWGINLVSILASVGLLTILTSGIACFRKREPLSRWLIELKRAPLSLFYLWKQQTLREKILAGLLVVVIIGAFGTLGYLLEKPQIKAKPSDFYIFGPQGKAANYPGVLAPGEEAGVVVGIVNHRDKRVTYYVAITIDGETVKELGPITLESEETWEEKVNFAATREGERQEATFLLYEGSREETRQRLHLWIDVVKGS